MNRLRLLSFNFQVGIDSQRYRHYVTKSWRHLLPSEKRQRNLAALAHAIRDYDVVGLQEVDAGSLRSGFISQVEYLAHLGQFSDYYQQINRRFGRFARHSNGLLSRFPVQHVLNHRLPGRIPGRGAIEAVLGGENPTCQLAVLVAHLSLGKRARQQQLAFLAERIQAHAHVCLLGDLNTDIDELKPWADRLGMHMAMDPAGSGTYPSWRPQWYLDHILVSRSLRLVEASVLDLRLSDHLPVAATIELPEAVALALGKHTVIPEDMSHGR
jgi:endonuclease/exonuclease/phosphatase family metal-dependent hydrolase